MFIFERERLSASRGEAERERQTQNPKRAPGSERSVQSLTWGSNSQTVRSWPELKSDAQLTEPPRCPGQDWFLKLTQLMFMLSTQSKALIHGLFVLNLTYVPSHLSYCLQVLLPPSPRKRKENKGYQQVLWWPQWKETSYNLKARRKMKINTAFENSAVQTVEGM